MTDDHSLVEELVREGRLTADEAAVHPQRSIITRALGVDVSVEVDVYPVELVPGDRLLLCSDGLTGMVQPDDIAATLRVERPRRAAAQLVDAANAAGGEDNITVVVVAVTDEAPLREFPDPIEPIEATEVEVEPTPEPGERRRRGLHGVGRVLLWALPIVLVLGIAVAAVGWYACKDYYVGASQGHVTVFKGVPGGLADGTRLSSSARRSMSPTCARPRRPRCASTRRSRCADAAVFVKRLQAQTTTTTTTTTSTTTTAPPTTTVPPTTAAPAAPR